MDYIVVGCGLSGAVIARHLAEKNKKVQIWERRKHVGGNLYDYIDEHGILVHKYGPHTFHTKKKHLYDYMCRFAEWKPYKLVCMAEIKGKITPIPFNFQTIDDYYSLDNAKKLKERINYVFGNRQTVTVVEAMQSDDEMVRGYAEFLFKHDYSLYTAKQWGIAVHKVDISILQRVPLRFSYDNGYFDDEYQAMPKISFNDFFQKMLDHPNIEVKLGVEALEHLNVDIVRKVLLLDGKVCSVPVIYTGAIDELFSQDEGCLPYRSLKFEWHHEDVDSKQPAPVVAYPEAEGFTRIVEFKKLIQQDVRGTTYEVEYPIPYEVGKNNDPYYPILTEESKRLAEEYKKRANMIIGLHYCGRLADFKYYDMDQALERALDICRELDKIY